MPRSMHAKRLLPLHLLVATLFQAHACFDPAYGGDDDNDAGVGIGDDDSAAARTQGVLVEVVGSDDARVRAESPTGLELDWSLVASGTDVLVEGSIGLWEVRWEGGGLQGVENPSVTAGAITEVLIDTDSR